MALVLFLLTTFMMPRTLWGADLYTSRHGISVAPLASVRTAASGGGTSYVFDPPALLLGRQFPTQLRRNGFEFVRLVVNPLPLLSDSWAARSKARRDVLGVVDLYLANGLSVIVDLHFWSPDSTGALTSAFATSDRISNYAKALVEMSGALADRPHGRVALELLNEPPLCDGRASFNWMSVQSDFVSKIRETTRSLPIVVTGCGGQVNGLIEFNDPQLFRDPNIIYTFHFYEPYIFTHQIVYCLMCGEVEYPQAAGAVLAAARASGPKVSELRSYLLRGADRDTLATRFAQVSRWAGEHSVPPNRVFLGEFGAVVGPTPRDQAMRASELRWLTDVRMLAEQAAFSFAYWSYPNQVQAFDYDQQSGFLRRDILRAIGVVSPSARPRGGS